MSGNGATPSTCGTEVFDVTLALSRSLARLCGPGPNSHTGGQDPGPLEVVDSATGRPIPCRISIRGRDGSWYFPESGSPEGAAVAYRRTAIGNPEVVKMHVTLSAHPFVVRLPPGRYTLTAERGKEDQND
jgi:hypothetical protein